MIDIDKETLEKLKRLQLEILKDYIRICEKYNLRYYIIGGSCIGALRHGGFIPWDDDIDVGMPRPDYERFLEVALSELPEHLFLQCDKTDPEYPMGFAKIRNSNTTFIESSVAHLKINHGIYFDIFPLDGFCGKPLFKLRMKIYSLCVQKIYKVKIERNVLLQLILNMVSWLVPDYRKARDKMNKLASSCKYEEHDTVASYFGAWGKKEKFPRRECFGHGSVGTFEGIPVMLPENPDIYCKQLYGNYMQLPPEEKRVSHHFCDVIDLERPYTDYFDWS